MARISYKDLLGLYMNHVSGRAGETFVERRDSDWTDKEWAALVECRNEIEELDRQFDEEQAVKVAQPSSWPSSARTAAPSPVP